MPCTFCHTKVSSKWASPNGLSVFVYPWKQKQQNDIYTVNKTTKERTITWHMKF